MIKQEELATRYAETYEEGEKIMNENIVRCPICHQLALEEYMTRGICFYCEELK